MGCFNVSCTISGLPIGAMDKIYVLPLIEDMPVSQGKNHYCPNDGTANMFFNIFALPFEAQYNDYGSFEEVVLDHKTKAICDFFGVDETEENMIAMFEGDFEPKENKDIFDRISFCFILKDVYDKTADNAKTILKIKKGSYEDYESEFPKFEQQLADYKELEKEYSNNPKLNINRALKYSPYRSRIFPIFKTLVSERIPYVGNLLNDIHTMESKTEDEQNDIERRLAASIGRDFYPLSLYENIDFNVVKNDVLAYLNIWLVMNALNKFFFPSIICGQDLNYDEYKRFNTLVLNQTIKQQKQKYGDDE